jgi:hypothetical protein
MNRVVSKLYLPGHPGNYPIHNPNTHFVTSSDHARLVILPFHQHPAMAKGSAPSPTAPLGPHAHELFAELDAHNCVGRFKFYYTMRGEQISPDQFPNAMPPLSEQLYKWITAFRAPLRH